jgi:hypothetical protein
LSVWLVAAANAGAGLGQGPSPAPGPTNPTPPAAGHPQAQPGATIVINPTLEECRRGWNSSMKWTRPQFEHFCTVLQASK